MSSVFLFCLNLHVGFSSGLPETEMYRDTRAGMMCFINANGFSGCTQVSKRVGLDSEVKQVVTQQRRYLQDGSSKLASNPQAQNRKGSKT